MACATYRAKVDCRIGGLFRKAGDVFMMEALQELPSFLESACEQSDAPQAPGRGGPAPVRSGAQVGVADIGNGKTGKSAHEVTSADMVTK